MTDLPPLLGQSPAFLEVMEQASRLAKLRRPLLVVGERGTGKELVAARLHFLSASWDGPFVKLNCAAIAESLLESELFGHEAGAFTGALRRREGRFEQADGGSLFLDEIGNAGLTVQEKILRVVEYGEVERLGGSETLSVEVRLIAATNADLPQLVAEGRFRADLLDRLAFDVLTLPPLRARRGDIPLLADHFGRAMALSLGWESFPGFSEGALAEMEAWPWPGNVRELRNLVERAVARAESPARPVSALAFDPFASPYRPRPSIAPDESPASPAPPEGPAAGPAADLRQRVAAYERGLLEEAMEASRHNQRSAARRLGLSYHQLRNSLKKHGLLGAQASS